MKHRGERTTAKATPLFCTPDAFTFLLLFEFSLLSVLQI